MTIYKHWKQFAKDHLRPVKDKRVGMKWYELGEIEGRIIDGELWVDMDAWNTREPEIDEID